MDTHRSTSPKNTTILPGTVFTLSAAANLARDLNFNGTISGNVWLQLYRNEPPNTAIL
jgi:hypothetical protein